MEFDGTKCIDTYSLGYQLDSPDQNDNCNNFTKVQIAKFNSPGLRDADGADGAYVPWEGIVDGEKSRASSLKCLT